MPMSQDKLKEILEAEINRIGVRNVRVVLPTRVVFRSERGGVQCEDLTPGQALDFLESLADGSGMPFDQFSEQLTEYLNEQDDEDDSDEDDDAPDEDEEPEDEDDER